MEKNKKALPTADAEYVASFEQAMKEVEAEYRRQHLKSKIVTALKREGKWNAEYLSAEFINIVGRVSKLSATQRDYITSLGALAKSIYDRSHQPENPEKPVKKD